MMHFSYIIIYNNVTTQQFLQKHSSKNNFSKRVWPKNNIYEAWYFPENPIKKLLTLQPAKSLILQAPNEIS